MADAIDFVENVVPHCVGDFVPAVIRRMGFFLPVEGKGFMLFRVESGRERLGSHEGIKI